MFVPEHFVHFPYVDVAVRILVAVGAGLLVGLERQWAHKELGSRTFTLVSLLGALAALISPDFVIAAFAGVITLVAIVGARNVVLRNATEFTTAAALMVTFVLGVLAGEGHVFTPASAAIMMTLLLSLKPQLTRFAGGLKPEEVRGAVMLGLIAFVIYPVLPNRTVDPWGLLNPREVWLTIILISAIGFVNYILLRLYSSRGIFYTAVFGGLINSTAAIAELSTLLQGAGENTGGLAIAVNLLTIVSMFVRNLVLLSIFSSAAGMVALWPILAMALVAAGMGWHWRKGAIAGQALELGSPLEIRKVASFGFLFILIQTAGTLGQRLLGSSGILVVSLIGGLASSASSTAAAAGLAAHGQINPFDAATCTVLASIASMIVNLPIIYRQLRDRRLLQTLTVLSVGVALLGLAVLVGMRFFRVG